MPGSAFSRTTHSTRTPWVVWSINESLASYIACEYMYICIYSILIESKGDTMTRHVFRTRLSPRFCRAPSTCPCAVKVVATPPWTLARGLRGLRALGCPLLDPAPMLGPGDVVGVGTSPSPVPRRRAAGRSASAELGSVELMSGALPRPARRALSCRVCTVRKWAKSSGHFISSRVSFDRVATVTTVLLQ